MLLKTGIFILWVALTGFIPISQAKERLPRPSIIKNTESFITEILAVDQKTNVILGSATGFFVENKRNEITLATVFHSFNLFSLMSESVSFFIKYQGHLVSMKEVTASFFPLQDLVFIHFQKSALARARIFPKPLQISLSHSEEADEPAYLVGYTDTIKLSAAQPYLDKLTFMANRTNLSGWSGGPILNSKGELISVLKESYANLVFGYATKTWNQLMKEDNCKGHLSECIFKARIDLYKSAKSGNKKAQRELFIIAARDKKGFDLLIQALNEYDSDFTSDDMEIFFKTVSREDLDILMIRIDAYQETPDMIYFLQNWNKLPSEGETSHIHIKYQACSLMMELIEPEEKEIYDKVLFDCLKEIAEQGFVPAQRLFGFLLGSGFFRETQTLEAVQWLTRAAYQGDTKSCRIIRGIQKTDLEKTSYCMEEAQLCNELQSLLRSVMEICP